jgi:hypothetical protein
MRRPAGGELQRDRTAAHHCRHERTGCSQHVLALVVEKEPLQGVLVGDDGLGDGAIGTDRCTEGVGNRRGRQPSIGQGREVDDVSSVGELGAQLTGNRQRQALLADPPSPVRVRSGTASSRRRREPARPRAHGR